MLQLRQFHQLQARRLTEIYEWLQQLHFHKFDTPETDRSVVVFPYLLKEYNRRWYLIAAAEAFNKEMNDD